MTDDETVLAPEIVHLTQRLNQALDAEIRHQHTDEDARRRALTELEAARDEASVLLEAYDEHR